MKTPEIPDTAPVLDVIFPLVQTPPEELDREAGARYGAALMRLRGLVERYGVNLPRKVPEVQKALDAHAIVDRDRAHLQAWAREPALFLQPAHCGHAGRDRFCAGCGAGQCPDCAPLPPGRCPRCAGPVFYAFHEPGPERRNPALGDS